MSYIAWDVLILKVEEEEEEERKEKEKENPFCLKFRFNQCPVFAKSGHPTLRLLSEIVFC